MNETLIHILPLLTGWLLDLLLGDPVWLPHPVVGFGRLIAFGEHRLNRGQHRKLKGGLMAISLIAFAFSATSLLRWLCSSPDSQSSILASPSTLLACKKLSLPAGATSACFLSSPAAELQSSIPQLLLDTLLIFYCLAGTTLIREVREVFRAVDCSLEDGRRQVTRIVGRETSELSAQEIRTAALETLAENLSDGVIAPLFWLAVGGVPGMVAYKMVNTLDSMIGYRTERYRDFGCWAARIDDVANYIPARLTALLMVCGYAVVRLASPSILLARKKLSLPAGATSACFLSSPSARLVRSRRSLISFILKYGRQHASPNSGYPEAALAGILDCRFGGPHYYFGELFDKPYIGENPRPLTTADMLLAVRINRAAEVLALIIIIVVYCL